MTLLCYLLSVILPLSLLCNKDQQVDYLMIKKYFKLELPEKVTLFFIFSGLEKG